jgi:hypothetical protein
MCGAWPFAFPLIMTPGRPSPYRTPNSRWSFCPFTEPLAPAEQLAGVNPSCTGNLGGARARLHRRCNNPFLLRPRPSPATLHRRDHFNLRLGHSDAARGPNMPQCCRCRKESAKFEPVSLTSERSPLRSQNAQIVLQLLQPRIILTSDRLNLSVEYLKLPLICAQLRCVLVVENTDLIRTYLKIADCCRSDINAE